MRTENNMENKLSSFFSTGNLPHALIIESVDRDLLNLAIKEISRYAVCENQSVQACLNCVHCKKAEKGIHPDIKAYAPETLAKSIPIDTIREIRKDAYIKPNEAKRKVYILKDCDNMSGPSANALLKVLEEPPQGVMFILTCTSCSSLLDTIKSRCQICSLNSGELSFNENKSYEVALDIINAVSKKDEAELLKALSKFAKNRDLLFETMKNLEKLFHEALIISLGKESKIEKQDILNKLAENVTKKALVYLVEESRTYQKVLKQNANINLLITNISISFYKSCSL